MNTQSLSLSRLAVPQLVRRRGSGRYTVRFREIGNSSSLVSIGLRTSDKRAAMIRARELAQTAKAFLLDNSQVTSKELNEHLKSMALTFLTDKVGDYWSGLEVDHIEDASVNLRSLAKESMTVDQQAHIVKALEVLQAARSRAHSGDTQPLLSVLASLNGDNDQGVHNADAPKRNLRDDQESSPTESTQEPLFFNELSDLYIKEHSVNLKPASVRDIQSAHKALKLFTGSIDWREHTRAEVSAMRDTMRDSGRYADATVNKMMAKLCAVINWAFQNGHIKHDYTKGLKVKGVKSVRRAYSAAELVKVLDRVTTEREPHKRLFGLVATITGARAGELTQLTKADIVNEEGHLCIDINDNGDKTIKTAASARLVPLTDGACGFSLTEFREWVKALPSEDSLVFGMSRDTASQWFNREVLPQALPERTGDLVLHSLRHTLATLFKQAGVSESLAGDVLGHSGQGITFGLYGKAKSIDQMAEGLAQTLLNNHSL
ncbi:tyrosine-type recombinase/integrase [Pantoea agglomerans]|uniref:tyrosine-type recombinase/integrase n=1 Tax=Enterobacter agglomerans TaxID=549 RepID=UPI00289D0170|nr:tyrosine-type recombinase/integrase [Pantoea agglomerans]WNK68452.1 tyrosine-type recombinase/integrase [Pantoea agglomerans]